MAFHTKVGVADTPVAPFAGAVSVAAAGAPFEIVSVAEAVWVPDEPVPVIVIGYVPLAAPPEIGRASCRERV